MPAAPLPPELPAYAAALPPAHQALCALLAAELDAGLPEATRKLWHGHPVWFLEGNPVAGYSAQKPGLRLMFWSGASFDEPGLPVLGGKFQDASAFFQGVDEVPLDDLRRWIGKAREIQWDYQHLVKRKGRLERLR
jgi:hypothetical protein